MRFILFMVFGLTCAQVGHACEALLGGLIEVDQLRPHMLIEVARRLEERDIADTLEPESGVDSYLESMNVRGILLVHRVSFQANNTVEVDLYSLDDVVENLDGGHKIKDGAKPIRLSWGHGVNGGVIGAPLFSWVGFVEGDETVLRRFDFKGPTVDLP